MIDVDEVILRSRAGRTSAVEESRLLSWRRASPANEAFFQDTSRLLAAAESVQGEEVPPAPSLEKLMGRGRSRQAKRAYGDGARWVWRSALVGITATAAVLAAVLMGRSEASQEKDFSFGAGLFVTGPKETATLVLSDGSVVRLAPQSRLRIPGVSGSREVFLEGRAYFAVAKMEGYPFQVRTQAGEAVVLGTRFEVQTEGEDLRLVVLEGRVALGSGGKQVEVGAGEVSRISRGTTTEPVRVGDVEPLVTWLERFIVFQATPLGEVARELEDTYGVRVEVTDSALAAQTVTGWYADRTFPEVFAIVCEVLQAECSIRDGVARVAP
jgi:ferric-dicitrate binding protein FerR (iron transport regulator)